MRRTYVTLIVLATVLYMAWYNIVMHQLYTSQLKPPPLGSRGRMGDLTLTLVKRHQCPYPLRPEFRSNTLTPEARKLKLSKVSRKNKCI